MQIDHNIPLSVCCDKELPFFLDFAFQGMVAGVINSDLQPIAGNEGTAFTVEMDNMIGRRAAFAIVAGAALNHYFDFIPDVFGISFKTDGILQGLKRQKPGALDLFRNLVREIRGTSMGPIRVFEGK
jgi:hypothetical protein